MDPRLPYALGALAGLARAEVPHSAAREVSNRPVGEVVTSAIAVATQLMKAPDGLRSIRSGRWSTPAASADSRLMCAVPVGIALSTVDLEAFAETVWFACGCTSRNEFQSAALLGAAVSIGINTQRRSHIDPLWDAVDVVSAMSPRGEEDGGMDVLEATQRALKAVANTRSDVRSSPATVLQGALSDCAPTSRIVPLAFFLAASSHAPDEASTCSALSGAPALCEAVAETLSGLFAPSGVLSDLDVAQCSEGVHVDWLGIAGQLLALCPPAPIDWIRRALGDSIPRVPRHDPSPFEASESRSSAHAAVGGPSTGDPQESTAADVPAGRVVVMSELMLRFDRRTKDERIPTGAEWSTREGVHLARPFPAMRAARSMGVAVLSLSPIGNGPRASIIAEALEREGIIDAGPRIARCDSGFASPVTTQAGGYKNARITGMPEDAWDEAVRTLDPSDVLYIDASIEDNPSVLAAAEHALAHLPRRVRIVLDVSGGHIGPRCLPNGNVLMVLGHGAAERLCLQIVCDRSSHDSTRNPNHAASYVLSLFKRQALVMTQTHESFLARPKSQREDEVIFFPAPTVISTDPVGTLDVSTGVLAAGFVLGCTIERSIVLANCAGALASTMPGPASCPTHEEIEAAARALTAREDIELERRTHAFGALAGVAFGDAIGMPARGMPTDLDQNPYHKLPLLTDAPPSHPTMPGASAGTLTAVTLEVLASSSALLSESGSPLRAEDEDRTAHDLAGSRYVLRAIPVGIATVTTDPEAFAQAVWQSCGNENLTVQEFQAAALVAAAISLAIDKKHYWVSGIGAILNEAINYVADLPTRGSANSGPDVLQATRKAIGIVHHFGDDMYERLRESIGTSADPTQSVPAAFGLILKYESEYAAVSATILGGETSLIAAIASAVLGAIRGVTMFSPDNLATIERVSHPGVAPLSERLIERREHICDEVSGGAPCTQIPPMTQRPTEEKQHDSAL